MEGILNFDLNDHYEKEGFMLASKSADIQLAIHEFDQELRSFVKYGIPEHEKTNFQTVEDAIDRIRNILREKLQERDVCTLILEC